jgi:hypothetical protein
MGDGVLPPAKVLRVEFYTAVRVLGNDGISDVTVLPGYYTSVSLNRPQPAIQQAERARLLTNEPAVRMNLAGSFRRNGKGG